MSIGLRGYLTRYLPTWLSDGHPVSPSYGHRLVWALGLMVDAALDVAMQGSFSAVGKGTPTALEHIGQARGLLRNQGESDAAYAERLATWVDRAKENGSAYRLALAIHDYLSSHPRVRIFRRNGECITVDHDRSVTKTMTYWDWDSASHPERADWWSDIWIVIYTRKGSGDPIEQWNTRPGTLGSLTGEDGFALGHMATHAEVDAIKGLIQQCKAAHSCVRAVIWSSSTSLFVPGNNSSMPDGTWGAWSINIGGSQVKSGRWSKSSSLRYWEPR